MDSWSSGAFSILSGETVKLYMNLAYITEIYEINNTFIS